MASAVNPSSGGRAVAQLAATLGCEFDHELLAAVVTVSDMTLRAELAKLVAAGILRLKGQPPQCTYFFKHALLEEAFRLVESGYASVEDIDIGIREGLALRSERSTASSSSVRRLTPLSRRPAATLS